MIRRAALLLVLSTTGCAVQLGTLDETVQHNTCTGDADCGDGASCVGSGDQKSCAANQVDLAGLRVVITPAAGSNTATTAPTILDPTGHVALTRASANGYDETFDATLPGLVQVNFNTTYPCDPTHKKQAYAVAAEMTLTSNPGAPGLPSSTFFSKSDPNAMGVPITLVPPGLYTAYIQPQVAAECPDAAPPPPALVHLCLQPDCPAGYLHPSAMTTLSLLGDLELAGTIGSSFSLEGWTLDLVDIDGGRIISDELILPAPINVATQTPFGPISFNWPLTDKPPVLRLRPAENVAAPTIYWDVASLPGSADAVKLTLGDFPGPDAAVTTQVIVLDNQGKAPQAHAQVTFESTSIEQLGTFSRFTTTVEADAIGVATAKLPPGTYDVRATPATGPGLSIGETTLTIHAMKGTSGGHGLLLPLKANLQGSVGTPQGDALTGVSVSAVPSSPIPSNLEEQLTTTDPLQPRPVSTTTNPHGDFSLRVDVAGAKGSPIDVSVRPLAESGFPWLVQPRLFVQESGTDTTLQGLTLSAPAILRGRLQDSTGAPVANADVAAYLPVGGPSGTPVYVQVGDATTDSDGNYVLTLPASLAP